MIIDENELINLMNFIESINNFENTKFKASYIIDYEGNGNKIGNDRQNELSILLREYFYMS